MESCSFSGNRFLPKILSPDYRPEIKFVLHPFCLPTLHVDKGIFMKKEERKNELLERWKKGILSHIRMYK